MPNPSNPYICPSCEYTTPLKWMIKRHFEALKKPCPSKTGVVLNPEIINYVLENHEWRVINTPANVIPTPTPVLTSVSPPTQPHPAIKLSQTFNNFNTIHAVVSNMESLEKIKLISDHQGIRHLDFEDRLESDFQPKLDKLENDEYTDGYFLSHDGLLKLVDGATRMDLDDINQFNILFDRTVNRVKILSCGKWDNYLEEIGIKEIIRLLKSYFFDSYELYLIKHIQGNDPKKNRFVLREHLDIYYSFIATFDLDATVCSQTDEIILGYNLKENNEYYLAEYYGKIYRDLKNQIKVAEKNKIKRRITNIIKENTTHNLNKINKIMMDLIKTDNGFIELLMETRKLPDLKQPSQ